MVDIRSADDWLSDAEALATAYGDLRDGATKASMTYANESQTDALALIAWDLDQFVTAAIRLARSGLWSPAYSSARLVSERAEYLLAVHLEPEFAERFMDRTQSIENIDASGTAIPSTPRMRGGDARGAIRRWIAERHDEANAAHFLDGTVAAADWSSFSIHPNAAPMAMAYRAATEPEQARFIAYTVASQAMSALFALHSVITEREPAHPTLAAATELSQRVLARLDAASTEFIDDA